MEEYYYLDANRQRRGPVTPDDFLRCGITPDTLVWKNGMSDWRAAGTLPELASRFMAPPPPPGAGGIIGNPVGAPVPETKPDNYLIWSILTTVLCCLPLGVVAIVYSAKVDNLWNSGDRAGAYDAAKNAKLFCLISVGIGLLSGIIAFFLGFIGALNG